MRAARRHDRAADARFVEALAPLLSPRGQAARQGRARPGGRPGGAAARVRLTGADRSGGDARGLVAQQRAEPGAAASRQSRASQRQSCSPHKSPRNTVG